VVLGFPCNQFGGQEPGAEAEIASFCKLRYGVSFPIFAKIDVNGPHAHPLFRYLKQQKAGLLGALGIGAIQWNFTKFLVDRRGKVVKRFASSTAPARLETEIEELLSA
jgi:glutathione peroxidase